MYYEIYVSGPHYCGIKLWEEIGEYCFNDSDAGLWLAESDKWSIRELRIESETEKFFRIVSQVKKLQKAIESEKFPRWTPVVSDSRISKVVESVSDEVSYNVFVGDFKYPDYKVFATSNEHAIAIVTAIRIGRGQEILAMRAEINQDEKPTILTWDDVK